MTPVISLLNALKDEGYRAFQCSLMPTVDPETVIGVRMPVLRKLAKALALSGEASNFLAQLPHSYYEENNLHGLLISELPSPEETILALDAFLPYVNNWATCDLISPQSFRSHPDILLPKIREWLGSGHTYTLRFGIGMLLKFYLDEAFSPEYVAWVGAVETEAYYGKMMIAWFFATALAKQYDAAIPYLRDRRLSPWIHGKTIQKALESYRIPPETKAYLRWLK